MAFVTDTFTDANNTALTSHTGELGATWTAHVSRPTVPQISDANRLRGTAGAGSACLDYASGVPASADYDVEIDAVCITDVASTEVSAMGRIDTAAETGYYATYWSGSHFSELKKIVAGAATSLGTYSHTISAGGGSARIKLEMRSTAIKLYVDGTERVAAVDSAITDAGRAGMRNFYTTAPTNAANYHVDNFAATDPVGAVVATMRLLLGVGT